MWPSPIAAHLPPDPPRRPENINVTLPFEAPSPLVLTYKLSYWKGIIIQEGRKTVIVNKIVTDIGNQRSWEPLPASILWIVVE